jgi:hypothetical protein
MAEQKQQKKATAAPAEVVGSAETKKSEVKPVGRPPKPWLDEIIKSQKKEKK